MPARLAPLLALGVLVCAACRPLTLPWSAVPASETPFAAAAPGQNCEFRISDCPASATSHSAIPSQDVPLSAHSPPGSVLALTVLPGRNELLAGVGPVDEPPVGLGWRLYRGRGDTWQRLSWPDEAIPHSFHVSPAGDTMFAVPVSQAVFGAGQAWGLMRSTDGGQTWRQVVKGLGDPYVMALALSPAFDTDHTLAAVTWRSGAYLSTNGGDSWQRLTYRRPIEPSGGANPYDLAVALSPDFQGGLAAGRPIEHGEVIASFGHGLRLWDLKRSDWRTLPLTVTTGLDDYDPPSAQLTAGAIAFSPSFSSDGTLYVYSGYAGLFRSTDRGDTWRLASRRLPTPAPPTRNFHLAVMSAAEVYVLLPAPRADGEPATPEPAGAPARVLYRSRDGGASWQALKAPPALGQVSAFALGRDAGGGVMLYLGGNHGGVSGQLADAFSWQ